MIELAAKLNKILQHKMCLTALHVKTIAAGECGEETEINRLAT